MRWAENPDDSTYHRWLCHYELVLPLRAHDIRREIYDDDGCEIGERDELVVPVLEPTKRAANHDPYVNTFGRVFYDEPYRDGKHAEWDSEALGGLPTFVIDMDGNAIPKPPNAALSRCGATDQQEGDAVSPQSA